MRPIYLNNGHQISGNVFVQYFMCLSIHSSASFPFCLVLFKVTLQVLALYLYLSFFSTSTSLVFSLAPLTTSRPFQFSFRKIDMEEEKPKTLLHLRSSFPWDSGVPVRSLLTASDFLTPLENLTVLNCNY